MIFLNLYLDQFHDHLIRQLLFTPCQDMLIFIFLFRPILHSFLGPFPFYFTNISLMTLRSHHSRTNGFIVSDAKLWTGLNVGLLNDLFLNGVLCYFSLRILLVPNQPTAVQQSIEAISQFVGDG